MNLQRLVTGVMVAGAVAIAVYAGWQYAALLRERERLTARLTEAQQSLAEVERARAQVEAELVTSQNNLQATLAEKATLTDRIGSLEEQTDRLTQEAAQAVKARAALEKTNATLKTQVAELTAQRNALDARLHSLDELTAAMQALQRRLREAGPGAAAQTHAPGAPVPPRPDHAVSGNRGFVIQSGVPTIGPARFRVRVLPYESAGGTPSPAAPAQPIPADEPHAGAPSAAKPAAKK